MQPFCRPTEFLASDGAGFETYVLYRAGCSIPEHVFRVKRIFTKDLSVTAQYSKLRRLAEWPRQAQQSLVQSTRDEKTNIAHDEVHAHGDRSRETIIECHAGYGATPNSLVAGAAGGWRASSEYAGRPFRYFFSWPFEPGSQRAGWL